MFLLLFSCGAPECPAGKVFNIDGLCIDAPEVPETEADSDSDQDSDTSTDSDTDSDSATTTTQTSSDWDAMGGETGVNALLDAFLTNVLADNAVNWMFANADAAALKASLHDQISSLSGGPNAYNGPDMKSLHADMAITDDQFNAVASDLINALDQVGLAHSADFSGNEPADRLVRAIAGTHDDIVTDSTGTMVLFNQLGGHTNIQLLIHQFVINVGADSRVNGRFATTDLAKFEALLVEQVCSATGGYCVYSGKSMLEAHTGMGITEDEFTAVVEDLTKAMDTFHVSYTQPDFSGGLPGDQLLVALASMHDDIVGR